MGSWCQGGRKEATRGDGELPGSLACAPGAAQACHISEHICGPFEKKMQLTSPQHLKVTTEALLLLPFRPYLSQLLTSVTTGLRVCVSVISNSSWRIIYDILKVHTATY